MQITTRPTNSPPATDLQLDPPGDGVQPLMGGTLTAYDPDTGENTVSIGGEDFSNLPVSGCCDFGSSDFGFDDYGSQVLLSYGDAGPIILGPLGAYPSEDPQLPDLAAYARPSVLSNGDALTWIDSVPNNFGDPVPADPVVEVTLLSASAQAGDVLLVFHGTDAYTHSSATDDPMPEPDGAVGVWTNHGGQAPVSIGASFGVFGFVTCWSRPVTTSGAQTVTLRGNASQQGLYKGVFGAVFVLRPTSTTRPTITVGPVAVRPTYYNQPFGAGAPEASTDWVAPSVVAPGGAVVFRAWQGGYGAAFNGFTYPSGSTNTARTEAVDGNDAASFLAVAYASAAAGAVGDVTARHADVTEHTGLTVAVAGARIR